MSGFKSGALELRKKDSLPVNADPSNILIAVDTQNRLYTVDENGVYRYLSAAGTSTTGSVSSVGISSNTLSISNTPITTSGNISVNLSLFGTSGIYAKISSDAYGRVISGTTLTSGDIPVLPYYPTSSSISWTKISGTPTTLSGYGITSSDNLFDKKYLMSGAYLPLSGGTLSGPGNLRVSGNEIVAGTIIASNFYTDANQNISISNPNNNGNNNILIGSQMGISLTSAATFNVFIGPYAGSNNISGSGNVYVGSSNGQVNAGSNNTFLGFSVGYNQLSATNLLLIDTGGGRGSPGAELSNSLIVGTGHTFPSLQTLSLNANTTVSQNLNVSGTTTLGSLNGILKGTSGVVSIATSSDFPSFSGLYLPLSGGTLSSPGNLNVSGNFVVKDYINFYGNSNSNIGFSAGASNVSGNYNSNFGLSSGRLQTKGDYNTNIGYQAGFQNTSAGGNTNVGAQAGYSNNLGFNTNIGFQAGIGSTGGNNLFLGYAAGLNQTSASNLIIIDSYGRINQTTELTNSPIVANVASSPNNQTLSLNANTTVSQKLNVSGTIQTNQASNNNGNIIAGNAALGTLQVNNLYSWFGYSGKNTNNAFWQGLIADNNGNIAINGASASTMSFQLDSSPKLYITCAALTSTLPILGLNSSTAGNANYWHQIAVFTIGGQYGSFGATIQFTSNGGAGNTGTGAWICGNVSVRGKQQNAMTAGLDVWEAECSNLTGITPSQVLLVKTTDNSSVKIVKLYIQNPNAFDTLNVIMINPTNAVYGDMSINSSLPAGTQAAAQCGLYDNLSTNISYIPRNLNVSGTIQTNAASNANGTVIANTAAIGTVPGVTQAWFGYSGLNSTTTTAMAGFRALPTGGCYINSNGSDSYIRFRPNNDQTVLEVTPTNVNTNALTTISNNLNVSGVMLGRQASQTANTNPYNLGNISPYWVFANTTNVVINLPASPSVGCAFCVVNATADGVTVHAGSAIISTIYNNFASSVAIARPSSFSNGPYNWFVYDGTNWWFTGSFLANY